MQDQPALPDREKVLISILGVQTNNTGERDSIELVTEGQLYAKNGVDYITYRESVVTGGDQTTGSTTMLKLSPQNMTLLRSGSVEQRQEFRPGELCVSSYITPHGSFNMGIFTNTFQVSRSETGKVAGIDVEYELELDGHWQSTNTLSILIKGDHHN